MKKRVKIRIEVWRFDTRMSSSTVFRSERNQCGQFRPTRKRHWFEII